MVDLRPGSEIADGIHWLKDTYVNMYLVELGDDLVLIDTGLNKKAKSVFKYIREELESRKISNILITHHHMDHTRGLHALHDEFHSRIFVSQEDRDIIAGTRKPPLPSNFILKPLFFILRGVIRVKPVSQLEIISEKETVNDFSIHHLPGHTRGSLGFLKETAFFSGDAAVTIKGGRVALGSKMVAESLSQSIASLKKLATMKFDILLPGHGNPILEDASDRVIEASLKL